MGYKPYKIRRLKLFKNYEIRFVWKIFPVLVEYKEMEDWGRAFTFRIEVNRHLSGWEKEITIAHELTHIKQNLVEKLTFGIRKKWWVYKELEAYVESLKIVPPYERDYYMRLMASGMAKHLYLDEDYAYKLLKSKVEPTTSEMM
ncbi:hypothetical protein BCF55_0441 [Hydrogenivirga caldilitoris]|uniref:Uncharacterized protein n=1 Tax=Hydrogenivirga caldilitoris TaxID=246264 RepID=A0A497XMN2_9AQUI|nr:hypothetical protein [Hydrogenivirga caldilitoris]RLJ70177.1 hypothetical protein BCF55_0441 [Hydrogenivirga caldilitoris]